MRLTVEWRGRHGADPDGDSGGGTGGRSESASVVEREPVHVRDLDRRTRLAGMHDLAVAHVDADMADRGVEEDQVTGAELALRHGAAHRRLHPGRVRQGDADLVER